MLEDPLEGPGRRTMTQAVEQVVDEAGVQLSLLPVRHEVGRQEEIRLLHAAATGGAIDQRQPGEMEPGNGGEDRKRLALQRVEEVLERAAPGRLHLGKNRQSAV